MATGVVPMTDPTSKAKKRRRAATVPGVVVTAATLGTTGLAFAYSVKTAPPTATGKSTQAAAVAAEITREKTGITQLHSSISSTEAQIKALQAGGGSTSQPPGSATPAGPSPADSSTSRAGTVSVASTPNQSVSSPAGSSAAALGTPSGAAAASAPAASGQPAVSSAPSPTPAPTPTPTTTPTTQPPPPPPPPPVTTTTGASGSA